MAADQGSVPAPRLTSEPASDYSGYARYDESAVSGYTALAGWLLILGGMWSFFMGLALVVRGSYFRSLSGYAATSHYAYQWTLTGWGWANLIFRIVVVAAGICLLLGQDWARWTGIVLAALGALGTFLFLPIYPFWSVVVIAVDVFIIWALATARRHQEI
jgi:hypothetical protein